jgi:hypothetical protein
MAPPRKQLNIDILAQLAAIQCTMKERASVMDCSVDTLERRYADIIKKGQDEGRSSLRRAQYKAAMGGNATMLVWLGKQILGQKDANVDNVPVETTKHFGIVMDQLAEMQRSRHTQSSDIKTEEKVNEH